MKIVSIFLIILATFVAKLQAQVGGVSVELTLEQEQFLSHEDIRVAVRITNRSGQTINFGKDSDWLTFAVEARDHYVVSQLSNVPVEGEFLLESSKTAIKRVNITPHFEFRQAGRYQVSANVKLPQWNKEIASPPVVFDIVKGSTLLEVDFGIPSVETNAAPEMRKYILQQAILLKKMRLYLRLTDSTGSIVYRVFPIAPMVSFSHPETQLDKRSNLHVLHQIYSRSFNYSVINPQGDVIGQQIYDYTSTRPVLRKDAEGNIFVSGGIQRITPSELQTATPAQSPDQNAKTKN